MRNRNVQSVRLMLISIALVKGIVVWGAEDPNRRAMDLFDPNRPPQRELEMSLGDGATLCLVGDCTISRPLSQLSNPHFQNAMTIVRSADLAFGNLETSIIDLRHFQGDVQAEYDDYTVVSIPTVAADMKRLGFDLLARANNHSLDWGLEGMRETGRWLDQAGLVYAGCGETAAQARAPRYAETAKGRVGLVSVTSWFPPIGRAMDPFRQAPGRPGVATLRRDNYTILSPLAMKALCWARDIIQAEAQEPVLAEQLIRQGPGQLSYELPKTFNMGQVECRLGETPGQGYEMHAGDLEDTLRNVRQGKQHADLLVVSHHCHDGNRGMGLPADYQRIFAHRVIDAGADVYVAHGTHTLMGIEIYQGKPLFYGLGNFFWSDIQEPVCVDIYDRHRGTLALAFDDPEQATDADLNALLNTQLFPGEGDFNPAFDGIIVKCAIQKGRIAQIRLYPVDLGYGKRLTRSGVPQLADEETAQRILEHLQIVSQPWATRFEIKNRVGILNL